MNVRRMSFAVAMLVILALAAAVVSADPGGPGGRGGGRGGDGQGRGQGMMRGFIRVISDETGLEPREIIDEVRADKTLAMIITENGSTNQIVIDAALAAATERTTQAVENGRITQERADEILAELPEQLDTLLNTDATIFQFDPEQGRYLMHKVAQEVGLNREEMREALESGQTLSAVLTANNVDVTGFTDELVNEAETRLNNAVENDRLTREEANERLSHVRNNLSEALEYVFPPRPQQV